MGSYVAVLDETGDKNYHVAKVIDIGERTTELHYHATRGKRLRNAKWQPLYTQPHTNVTVMELPETITRHHTLFRGIINTLPIDGDSLILLPNLGMTDKLRIGAKTRAILKNKSGYSHHRLGDTWKPT